MNCSEVFNLKIAIWNFSATKLKSKIKKARYFFDRAFLFFFLQKWFLKFKKPRSFLQKEPKKERLTFPLESDQGKVSKNQVGPRHRTQLAGYLLFRQAFCRKIVKKSIRETTAKVLAAPPCGGFHDTNFSRNGRYYDRNHRTDGTVRSYSTDVRSL